MELPQRHLDDLDRDGYVFILGKDARWLRRVGRYFDSQPGYATRLLDPTSGSPSYSHAAPGLAMGTSVCVVMESRISFAEAFAALQAHPERRERLRQFRAHNLAVED